MNLIEGTSLYIHRTPGISQQISRSVTFLQLYNLGHSGQDIQLKSPITLLPSLLLPSLIRYFLHLPKVGQLGYHLCQILPTLLPLRQIRFEI